MNIYTLDDAFDTSLLKLSKPLRMKGSSSHFCKILYKNDPLYIRTNRCKTKNGIVDLKLKTYADIIISDDSFSEWLASLEDRVKQILLKQSENWFEEEMDMEDIEYYFNSSIKTMRGGLQTLRVYIKNKDECLVFDENETTLEYKDVANNEIVTILQPKGLRFTSESFQIEIEMKQILVLQEERLFQSCIIRSSGDGKTRKKKRVHFEEEDNIKEENEQEKENDEGDEGDEGDEVNEGDEVDEVNEGDKVDEGDKGDEEDGKEVEENKDDIVVSSIGNDSDKDDDEVDVWQDVAEDNTDVQTENNKGELTNKENCTDEEEKLKSTYINILQQSENEIVEDKGENTEQVENIKDKGNDDILQEYEFDVDKSNTMEIKNHKEVYKSIYKEAKEKALKDRKQAMDSLFELRKIKNMYMIDDEDLEFV